MKVLVLNGSPKKQSDTIQITRSFTEGLCSEIKCEVKEYHIIDLKIGPCLGCLNCWKGEEVACTQEDDMNGILKEIEWADLIIWSFPLYCYGMPSHLKALCDRLLPLTKKTMKEENGRVIHEIKGNLIDKNYLMVCGCGFPNFEGNFMPAVMQFRNCFGQNAITICIPEAPMFNAEEAQPVTLPLLEKIKAAGREYARTGTLTAETVKIIQTPMIPNEIYIQIINGNR